MHTSVHRVTNYENVVYKHMKIEDCFFGFDRQQIEFV